MIIVNSKLQLMQIKYLIEFSRLVLKVQIHNEGEKNE